MCILCDNWASTPHAARPTTDISCSTGHELMLLGFYLGAWSAAQSELPSLCPAHENIMNEIAQHKEGIAAMEAAAAVNPTPKENLELQAQYKQRIAKLQANTTTPIAPPSVPSFTLKSIGLNVPVPPLPPSGPNIMPIPPVSGIDPNMLFECPNCKQQVTNGLVHDCVYTP